MPSRRSIPAARHGVQGHCTEGERWAGDVGVVVDKTPSYRKDPLLGLYTSSFRAFATEGQHISILVSWISSGDCDWESSSFLNHAPFLSSPPFNY